MPARQTRKRRTKRKRFNIEEEELLAMAMCPSPTSGSPSLSRSEIGVAQTMNTIAHLERCIARILLLRYQQDIARLYSTRLHNVALEYLPRLVHQCAALGGPGWVANNADCEEVKDFFRANIAMDLRQSGERVATKSVLWSYTAIRHFAISHNVSICSKRGLHSLRLLPYYPLLKAHMHSLESLGPPTFTKPPTLGPLSPGLDLLFDHSPSHRSTVSKSRANAKGGNGARDGNGTSSDSGPWDDWRTKLQIGYERLVDTLWRTSREFDVRGYGLVLREKLTTKWCDCGCSTDNLGEVCERTVREDEEEAGKRAGKEREWDGRGSGVWGWESEEEEDVWEARLDFGGGGVELTESEEAADGGLGISMGVGEMSIGEMMQWRYVKAERAKERGNEAFKKNDFELAVRHYAHAYRIEPELPHYQLNLAAAHLKLENWAAAERACTCALGQHKSTKGYWRRAKARKMQGRPEDAIRDLRAILRLQPHNTEALLELASLQLPPPDSSISGVAPGLYLSRGHTISSSSFSISSCLPSTSASIPPHILQLHPAPPDKHPKPSLPFPAHDLDRRRLKICCVPIEIGMSMLGELGMLKKGFFEKWVGGGDASESEDSTKGKSRGQHRHRESFAASLGFSIGEKLNYPSWERVEVRRLD